MRCVFLLVSREPFDYQEWRREYFSRYNDLDELLQEFASITALKILSPFPSGVVPTFADRLRPALV
jgi:hypothetical protein